MTADMARQRFAAVVQAPDETIDVAEAALLIAAEAYPGLEIDRYMAALDKLAESVAVRVGSGGSARDRVRALIYALAIEQRFVGNQKDFYDRRNSFLNEVLERRTGIPITLALVYMEVARRLRMPVRGVGFPGHFLAKYAGEIDIVIDPFYGHILSERECEQRLQAVMGRDARFDRALLRAATPREMLVRILRNLKQIYLQAREYAAALACSERVLLVTPDLPHEVRDRGLLYAQLECYAAARVDLERFLHLAPDDDTAPTVRERLIEISRQGTVLH